MSHDIAWPHSPVHRLAATGTYFVTASTLHKEHLFRTRERLDVLQRGLLGVAAEAGWQLEAWAIFSNHYHFVAHSPDDGASSLPTALRKLHGKTAAWINKLDGSPRRRVWFNYRETILDLEGSYLARLNYVHQNPVHHGLVPVASQYRWCSAAWFERTASQVQVRKIYSLKLDRVRVADEFEVPAVE